MHTAGQDACPKAPQTGGDMLIDIGICAFRRPSIFETMNSVAAQALPEGIHLRVIIAENDETPALQDQIEAHAAKIGLNLHYVHAPARNISIARNACLDATHAAALVFIDDDEFADPNWLREILRVWQDTGAGVVFGPVAAVYPDDAPEWMKANDFHSIDPVRNRGVVETGYTSNALLDQGNRAVAEVRFDLAFGRTGGEDVDLFFRLSRSGVKMEVAETAVVREPVAPSRMSFRWLLHRRYRTGAIYGDCVAPHDRGRRVSILLRGILKAIYCGLRAALVGFNRERSSFWAMRGAFHVGVVSGCLTPYKGESYGHQS